MAEGTSSPSSSHDSPVRLAALGIAASLAAFVLFGGLRALGVGATSPDDPFDAMPRDSFLLATLDVESLRASPLGEALLARGEARDLARPMQAALGVGSLAESCGFDPLDRVSKLAVGLPEEGEKGAFGIAARVAVTRDEIERCAGAMARRHDEGKGSGERAAEAREVGSFFVLGGAGDSGRDAARLAYGRGGLLVVAKGSWFDAMLAAADRKGPAARDATEHTSLRTSLTSREGFRKPTLLATALLPRAFRKRLEADMGDDAAMSGILGISAIGVALQAGRPGQDTDLAIELACDTGQACEAVETLIDRKRFGWSKDLSLRLVGLGPLVDSIKLERNGTRLRAAAGTSAVALASTLDRVFRLRGGMLGGLGGAGRGAEPRPTRPPVDAPPPPPRNVPPDETIK